MTGFRRVLFRSETIGGGEGGEEKRGGEGRVGEGCAGAAFPWLPHSLALRSTLPFAHVIHSLTYSLLIQLHLCFRKDPKGHRRLLVQAIVPFQGGRRLGFRQGGRSQEKEGLGLGEGEEQRAESREQREKIGRASCRERVSSPV